MKTTSMNFDKAKAIAKGVGTIVAGYGVGEIVGALVYTNCPKAKGVRKFGIMVGAVAITAAAIRFVTDSLEKDIDDIADAAKATYDKVYESLTEAAKDSEDKKIPNDEEEDEDDDQ